MNILIKRAYKIIVSSFSGSLSIVGGKTKRKTMKVRKTKTTRYRTLLFHERIFGDCSIADIACHIVREERSKPRNLIVNACQLR